jgi:hypothetical protein
VSLVTRTFNLDESDGLCRKRPSFGDDRRS